MKVPFPIMVAKEGKWFVASCPPLNIATQGKTKEEVEENIKDLIQDYLKDPDTSKPKISMVSFSLIPINVPKGVHYSKAFSLATA